ncbi:hypothetical protein ACFLKB_06775 [Clostridium sp. FAM 1755]
MCYKLLVVNIEKDLKNIINQLANDNVIDIIEMERIKILNKKQISSIGL